MLRPKPGAMRGRNRRKKMQTRSLEVRLSSPCVVRLKHLVFFCLGLLLALKLVDATRGEGHIGIGDLQRWLAMSGRKRDPVGGEFPAFRCDIPRSLFSVSLWVPRPWASRIATSCARLDAYTRTRIHVYPFIFFLLSPFFSGSSLPYYRKRSRYQVLSA